MTPEAQRIAIAEACPNLFWVHDPNGGKRKFQRVFRLGDHPGEGDKECDLLADLNAIHEVEKVLTTPTQKHTYLVRLHAMHIDPRTESLCEFTCTTATAAQRAEAFLRTIGKWEDGK